MNESATHLEHEPTPTARHERPATAGEAAELLRETSGSVFFQGAGTKLDWAGRVAEPDLVLDTADLRGVLTYNPADMTASVRAGTPLRALQEHLAAEGQWLALDPPGEDAGATIGGLLAAGDSGPSRLRYGALRDLVIGVTLVLSDGTMARSGGHVIKNVAGYDLAKLVHGSLGSLALVAEVVVRLHPLPPTSMTTVGEADAALATAAALALAASPLEPAAVEWVSNGESGRLHVRMDGSESYAAAASGRATELLSGLGISAHQLSTTEAERAWENHRSSALGTAEETVLRVSGLPSDLGRLAAHTRTAAQRAGVESELVSSTCLGLHTLRLRTGEPAAHAQALTEIRDRASEDGASVLLRRRPAGVDDLVDPLGPAPTTVELLRRIKDQFDPAGRCAPGRFHPWY